MALLLVTVVQRIQWHKLESTLETQRLYPSNKLIGRFAAALYRQFIEVLELLNIPYEVVNLLRYGTKCRLL